MANKKNEKGSLQAVFLHADGFDKLLMSIGFFGAVCEGITMPLLLLVTGKIMNKIGAQRNTLTSTDHESFTHSIKNYALIMCYVGFARWLAGFLVGYCWTRTAERQAGALRTTYLKAVLRQEIGYFDLQVTNTAEVISSVSTDSLIIQDFIGEKLPAFLMNVSNFIGAYLISFILLWRLVIVAFPCAILVITPGIVYGRVLMGIARKKRIEYTKADVIVEQAVSSIRTVYSFVGEYATSAKYSAALQRTVQLGLRQGLAKGLAVGSNGISYAIWSLTAYYGSRMVMYHGAKGGTVFSVGFTLIHGGLAFGSALPNLRYFSEASEAAERIMKTVERVPEIDSEDMGGEIIRNVSGEVEFKQVEFAYPSRPESVILKEFNLKIPAGKTVALIGESGSGKSTVVALLQRFYDPIGGHILLDGVNIDRLQLKWLRSQLGLVNQEPALFATTIKDNILFGKEDASCEDVIEAAKAANAHDFISQLPQGYDTQVGERGIQMSGGQKQRIAIARAIIKAPKILLLDEATSALDTESEKVVQEALDKVAIGVTTIVIAHRLSTIRNADLIAVVQDGLVMEIGSHDELMKDESGSYATLIRLQQTDASSAFISSITPNHKDDENAEIHRSISSSYPTAPGQEADENGPTVKAKVPVEVPSFRRLIAMNSPEWRQGLVGCISAMLCGAIQPSYAFTLGRAIGALFLPDHREIKRRIEIYCLIFLGLALFSLLINICQHYNFAAMGEYLTQRIRERMFSKILTFEIGWFDAEENSTGAICSRLATDANVVRSFLGDRMSLLIQATSTVTIASTVGLIISWRLALVMVAFQPLVICCFCMKYMILKSMSRKAIKAQDTSSKIASEAVSNIRTITAFNSQIRILKLLQEAQEGLKQESIRLSWFTGIGLGSSNAFLLLTFPLSCWYSGKLIVAGDLKVEAFFQVFILLISIGRTVAEAGTMTSDITKGSEAVGSVFSVLDRHSSIEPEDPEAYKPDKITGHIEFLNVHFAYPSRSNVAIFEGFSLEIEPAKSTAMVGHSGSGKSTIIGLIERYYDPLSGLVKIDGRDLKSYHLRALRKHIALVSQEPALFAGTIRQNITYGASVDIDESEVIEAAKAANAHEFITGLKDGYDTFCGDKGLQLSGGQKQRIAIARAVLKNPTILLLDEATSALDGQSEKVVQDALDRIMMGRTSVVVAHRLSTIQNCDNIYVLDKGKVVEKGTHSSLLAKGPDGAYFSLVSLQMNTTSTH
ncbi:OLC1v1013840C1 [Oldenlandia corymbosa var. corymbosa]|uniref:OLC1v1013840C1 n=1 Tax=Oldenlandia corymbosa var. corymbosa TaxID=529605 RepID=A0AAV1E1D2_OLDCO|nr:OLC1v1013840C1 [Oldenlandia corymbosa var. corymbosa]